MTMKKKKASKAPAKPCIRHGNSRLAHKQKRDRFVYHYLNDPDRNATRAAIAAGFSEASAKQTGHRLLARPDIKAQVQEIEAKALKPLVDRYEVTADRIVRELALLGFSNMADYVTIDEDGTPRLDLSGISTDQAAAIKDIDTVTTTYDMGDRGVRVVEKTKIRLADKRAALVDLGKTVGLFRDGGDTIVPVQFVVEWVRPEKAA